jgi:hypothetical protein
MKKLIICAVLLISLSVFAADSLKVVWGVVDKYAWEYTASNIELVKFKAWLNSDPTDVINETNSGNSVEIYQGVRGACIIDLSSFEAWEWQDGDRLCLLARDENDGLKGYYEGYADWAIPWNASGIIELGFEDFGLTGSGYPLGINSYISSYELYNAQINVVDKDGMNFDFTSEPYDNVTFQCWISGRETDIVDQNSEKSAYGDLGTTSVLRINTYDFQTRWNLGDTLNVSIKHDTPGLGYYTGTKKYVFTYTSTSEYWVNYIDFGFEGDPVIADTLVEDPRTITYNCIKTDSTGYNFIALPYDAGFTKASDLDLYGEKLNSVGKWLRSENGWRSACYNSYFGWVNDFDVEVGQPYMINSVKSFDFTVTGDSIYIPPYNFSYDGYTPFMVPMNMIDVSTNRDFWYDPGTNFQLMRGFDPADQTWDLDGWSFTATPFAVYPGMGILGKGGSEFTWPQDKKTDPFYNYSSHKEVKNGAKLGGPKPLVLHIVDKNGNDFDFSSATVKFKAWIDGNEYDVITQETPGSSLLTIEGMSVCYVETSKFMDVSLNDSIVVEVRDETADNFEFWTIGRATYDLGSTGDPLFMGFESVLPGTGEPISTTEPSGLDNTNIPIVTKLHQNYPNPFNPETSISFSLPKEDQVTLSVFNINGQLVKELVNEKKPAGNHSINFNASDLNSGIYFYTLETGDTKQSRKMLFVK